MFHNARTMGMKKLFIFLGLFLLVSFQSAAQEILPAPQMVLPVDCEIGWNCWIANYVDHDKSEGAADYTCGHETYDKHKGTDFLIRNRREMLGGVSVRAAADGVVLGVRDGMKDIDYRKRKMDFIAKKECGNGIRIKHENGWVTQYCHLRKNSVKVKKGEKVHMGDIIGFVGNSGFTMYPHLHFQVEYIEPKSGARSGAIVDPFVGVARNDLCGVGDKPLWPPLVMEKLDYKQASIIDSGFAATQPKLDGIVEGLYDDETLSIRSPQLILWARILHVKKGDKVTFTIFDPEEKEIFSYTSTIDKDQAHRSLHAGLRSPGILWDEGAYRGEVKLLRPTDGTNGGIYTSEATIYMR